MQITGPHASAIDAIIPDGFIADDLASALHASGSTPASIATLTGDVVRGRMLVSGGSKDEGRAILGIKREIKELRDRIAGEEAERDQSRIRRCGARDSHRPGVERGRGGQCRPASRGEGDSSASRCSCSARPTICRRCRRNSSCSRSSGAAPKSSARDSTRGSAKRASRLRGSTQEQRAADEKLSHAQHRLGDAREALQALARRAAEAKASLRDAG